MTPHFVYRLFDQDGHLLYIGCTSNFETRCYHLKRDKDWWPTVATHSIAPYESKREALDAECAAINSEDPRYNILRKGFGRGRPRRRRPPEPDLVTLSTRVPRELADALKVIADREYRYRSAEIRRLIEERIASAAIERQAA